MTIKRKMDVESALRFAYRDELPKRGAVAASSTAWDAITRYGEMGGERIDCTPEPGFPAILGEPHPDALAIEQAVRGLSSLSGAELGDDALSAGIEGFCLDETTYVARAMQNIPALVAIHARLGRRPPFGPAPVMERVVGANGKPVVVRQEPYFVPVRWQVVTDKRGRKTEKPVEFVEYQKDVPAPAIRAGLYPEGAMCPLACSPRPEFVMLERAEYAVWWAALDYLAETLAGELDTIAVTMLRAPQRPWLGETERTIRVHVHVGAMETKSIRAMA